MSSPLDDLITELKNNFTTHRRVAVIGSTSFWNHSTPAICETTGRKLAQIEDIVMLTGGVSGVPEALSRSFWRHQKPESTSRILHIQPKGFIPWEYGENLTAGDTFPQRRWVLAHLAPVYLLLEGGPGALQEAQWALNAGAIVIPVGCTGGAAKTVYAELTANSEWLRNQSYTETALTAWQDINNTKNSVEKIATAIIILIEQSLEKKANQTYTKQTLLTELEHLLAAGNWQAANEITFALFRGKTPKDVKNPGWIHYNLDEIEADILQKIDRLWVYYSQGKFGFSVQWQIYYQLDIENDLDEEIFAKKVGRHEIFIPYDVNKVNFNLDCPSGHLPWFYWRDYTKPNFYGGGIMGGGGVGWVAIFELEDKLERFGVISPAGKQWNREEVIEAISKGERIFSRGNLRGIDLQGLDLSGCYFIKSDLSHSNLSSCKLNQSNFHSANLYEANLENVQGENTCFQKANLEGTIFTYSRFIAVNFFQCYALRAVFDQSEWQNVNARCADFWGASFYHSRLNNCDFQKSDGSYSNWQEAILENCNFINLITTKSGLKMTHFIGKEWNQLQYKQANLSTVNITLSDNTKIEVRRESKVILDGRKPRIMVIDDSITVRELLAMNFHKVGYEVITARDGLDAWEKLKDNLVCDFIFCDVEMPKMDGIEFVSRMKKDEQLKNIPIAILSSRLPDRMRPNFWNIYDIVGRFTKPYSEDVLLGIVAKTLGINYQIQDISQVNSAINIPQTRFLAIGLNLEQRKNLVAFVRYYPQFLCSFFPEDEIINPDDSGFDYQSLTHKLKQRTRNNIHISLSLFSLSKTCTFIPDHFLINGDVGYPISYPVYLVIDVQSFQSSQRIDFDFNFQEIPVILVGDKQEIIATDWNIQGCVSNCEEIMDIIERR
ncbi:GUN4 domain-containing protein [Okeanomitos corallinicola TIOX110]|uniref:GUN4 domain-containing protein n=1 Tax=Okeanomitos corallinicola TIOX110 TaxID=3133117 RepID=A0ABZ2V2B3_9CYAN